MDWLKLKDSFPCNRAAIAALMHSGQWQLAIKSIPGPRPECADSSDIYSALVLARCHLAIGSSQTALHLVQCVILAQPAAASLAQWLYAHLLVGRAQRTLGSTDAAIAALTTAYQRSQTNPQINQLLAECLIDRYGDWSAARQLLVQPGAAPSQLRGHAWFAIQSQIYNGLGKPETLTQKIVAYSQQYLSTPATVQTTPAASHPAKPPKLTRKRLGLASHMFCASPVYFLCIGALRHLAQEVDLVFFHSGKVQDWATAEFHSLATEWHEASDLGATALASLMRRNQLDVLFDMAGWLDQTVLQAIAQRPARQLYKWVGGQSATTGLSCFDGYITDCHQSPMQTASLYSEPLVFMPSGYVTYTPPPYLPAGPSVASDQAGSQHAATAGIVAHPKKLSAAFMHYLRGQIRAHALGGGDPVNLCFIGWRYADALLQQRINQTLGLDASASDGPVSIHYRSGNSHAQQLELVAALDWVVDTFPYSAGVTALEALALGVPIRTHAGQHFSQRHAYSHARFAGQQHDDILLSQLGALGHSGPRRTRPTLLPPHCARRDHVALAQSLSQLLGGYAMPLKAQA
jgi:hypothetical protein